jgi:hypothetical protein
MPKQKDLKRVVRARMQKTGESYTTARLVLVKKKETPEPDYAKLAGMSDETIKSKTGRSWREWVAVLDAEKCAGKPRREIARYVASPDRTGGPSVTVIRAHSRIARDRAASRRRL